MTEQVRIFEDVIWLVSILSTCLICRYTHCIPRPHSYSNYPLASAGMDILIIKIICRTINSSGFIFDYRLPLSDLIAVRLTSFSSASCPGESELACSLVVVPRLMCWLCINSSNVRKQNQSRVNQVCKLSAFSATACQQNQEYLTFACISQGFLVSPRPTLA
jgi:hypothetical protein